MITNIEFKHFRSRLRVPSTKTIFVLVLLFQAFANVACTDAYVVNGEAYLSSDPDSPTAMVYEPLGSDIETGYVEMYFGMESALKEGDGIAALLRGQDNGGSFSAHLCLVTVEDGALKVGVGGIVEGQTFIYQQREIWSTLAAFVGYHKLGCEIKTEDEEVQLNVYLDDVLKATGLVGSSDEENDSGVVSEGLVGFAGLDQDDAGISGLRVRTFRYFEEKP